MMPTKTSTRPTAGIVIIGDEILKGQIQDDNTVFLAKELHSCGIKLDRVSIIPDDIDVIAEEIKVFCSRFTYVFTTGGLGPTHDDVTIDGIAKAFNDEIIIHPEMMEVLEMHHNDLNEATIKMAKVPKTAMVDYSNTGKNSYPLVTIQNLFVFPGIPKLLRQTFDALRPILQEAHESHHKPHVREMFVVSSEFYITDKLNALVTKYKDSVTFGSYPELTNNYYETKLTIEASDEQLVNLVVKEVQTCMDTISFDKSPTFSAMDKIEVILASCEDEDFKRQVNTSKRVIKECFEKYTIDQVAIAFNGGKDCMVMLHLTFAHLRQEYPDNSAKLQALYIYESDPFKEVESFIQDSTILYDLDLVSIQGPMKGALTQMLLNRPNIKAMLMGTRIGDPGSKGQINFSPTDGDWPSLMRVNPILEWEYKQVWTFLRGLTLPYPTLYDHGYTSLGNKRNTCPNPNLAISADDLENTKFKPAYQLEDGSLERAGRGA